MAAESTSKKQSQRIKAQTRPEVAVMAAAVAMVATIMGAADHTCPAAVEAMATSTETRCRWATWEAVATSRPSSRHTGSSRRGATATAITEATKEVVATTVWGAQAWVALAITMVAAAASITTTATPPKTSLSMAATTPVATTMVMAVMAVTATSADKAAVIVSSMIASVAAIVTTWVAATVDTIGISTIAEITTSVREEATGSTIGRTSTRTTQATQEQGPARHTSQGKTPATKYLSSERTAPCGSVTSRRAPNKTTTATTMGAATHTAETTTRKEGAAAVAQAPKATKATTSSSPKATGQQSWAAPMATLETSTREVAEG
mmetsp:Transcript_35773/g.47069  ORF Transcript_35773/g.47069 Transcript_35773/m.47069 type:complete len:322 (-) Transcript_35773:309-1274(-)